jgi:hypothetical protein
MSNNEEFRKQLYNNLNMRETEELTAIYEYNDHYEWDDLTFEVIKEILQKRLNEVPTQGKPVYEENKTDEYEYDEEDIVGVNAPVFYKPKETLWVVAWLNRAAIASLIISFLLNINNLAQTERVVLGTVFGGHLEWEYLAWVFAFINLLLTVGWTFVTVYIPLKALEFILKILMETEFNSRVPVKEEPEALESGL